MLGRIAGVAGFGPGIDHVEDILLLAGVIARFLIAFVPVGVLDDEVHLGIDLARQVNDLVGELLHHVQAVILPGLLALGLDAHLAPAGGEEEIVQYDLIKHAGQLAHDAQVFLAVAGIGIAEGIVVRGLAHAVHQLSRGDAAGGFDAVLLEQRLDRLQLFDGNIHRAAVIFNIHLVQMDVLFEVVDAALDLRLIGLFQIVGVDIGRNLEVLERFHVKNYPFAIYFPEPNVG